MRKARNTSNKHRYLKNCIVAILLVFTTALSTLAFDSLETQAAATEWNFSYTGGVQTWTAPYNGTFAIEAYGAAGGSYGINPGGYGGKVASTFTLQAGDVLKIYNGSAGTGTSGGSNALGHNGGTGSNGSAGGGASTVITLTRNGNTYTILEAGGGGGANGNSGGSHGGTTTLSTSGNIGGSGFGGGGGGYIAGASGASIIQEDPFVWIPDMTVSNKQYNINASKVSGSYTYIGGASDSYGYTEKVDGVYSYMQLLKSGAINENFTGLASVSEGQVVQYRSVMDVHLDADYNGSTSYVSVVDQNMRVLYSLTLGQIANGYDIGTVNHSYKVLGSDSSGRAKWDYNFNITYTVPSGVTKIGVIQHVVSETPNTGSWSSGIYVPYFGVINAGYKSSGGSNYISTAFSAKDTSSESGINNGNGYTKITALHTHSYTSSITTAATCTTKGVRTYTCSCGDSYTEEIPALGHAWPTDYSYAKRFVTYHKITDTFPTSHTPVTPS